MFYSTHYRSPVGNIVLAGTEESIVGLWIEGQKYFGDTVPGSWIEKEDLPILREGKRWLDEYFAGKKPEISRLPLAPIGGEFRQTVWKLLTEIPYGEVTTYGRIAKEAARRLGKTGMANQAAGGAVVRNPISIIIPCHRVVGTNGSLTGYSGGLATKIALLKHEGVNLSELFVPKKGTAL